MTYQNLEDFLNRDLAWRKKEIINLLLLSEKSNSKVLYKSLILLLYSHWEGYIKNASIKYLFFVSDRKVCLKDLTNNFRAIMLKKVAANCFESQSRLNLSNELTLIKVYAEFDERIFEERINPEYNRAQSVIETNSNLKAKVLKSIHEIIGIPYKDALQIRSNYINEALLGVRNSISHGNRYEGKETDVLPLTEEEIKKLKGVIFTVLEAYRDDLLEYASGDFFLKNKEEEKKLYDLKREEELNERLESFDS